MLRIVLRTIIGLVFAVSSVIHSPNHSGAHGTPLQPPAADPMVVIVSFDGLMVFQKDKSQPIYKVGILLNADGHKFKVLQDGKPKEFTEPKKGARWTLFVTNSQTKGVEPVELGHDDVNRLDDYGKPEGQYDFSWILDLDELHDGLKLKSEKLNPVILLTQGVLYSRYKADLMDRKGGAKTKSLFFTETVALKVSVPEGEALVLTDADGTKVVDLRYKSGPQPIHEVSIQNVRDKQHSASDFQMYYQLFEPVKPIYDFDKNPSNKPPLNAVPRPALLIKENRRPSSSQIHSPASVITTCCGLRCNSVLLNSTQF